MPPVSDSAKLAESHRVAQATRSTLIAAAVARWWLTLVKADDPATIERWLAAVIPAIMRGRGNSAVLAATYSAAIRRVELPGVNDGFRFDPIPTVEEAKLRTSLMVVGPQAYANALKKIEAKDASPEVKRVLAKKAVQSASAAIEGATVRHVADGGRVTVAENAAADPKTIRVIEPNDPKPKSPPINYARVLGDDPCYFCAMLASRAAPSMTRGGRYYADSFTFSDRLFVGDGNAKVHDHCQCTLTPVYRSDDEVLQQAEQYADIWHRSGATESGKAAILAFRREFEGRTR